MRWIAPALLAVVTAACAAASASEPTAALTVTADSVVLVYTVTAPAQAGNDSVVHRAGLGTLAPGDTTLRTARALNDSAGRTVRFAWPKGLWTPNVARSGQACSAMLRVNPETGATDEGPGKCATWTFTRDIATPAQPTAITIVSVGYTS